MKTRLVGTLTVALALVTAGLEARADDAAARREITRAYARIAQTGKKKDMKAYFAILTPDATFVEVGGQAMKREQLEKVVTQMMGSIQKFTQVEYKPEKITVKGETAATALTMKTAGTMTEGGRTQTFAFVSKLRDYWVKTPQGWRIKRIEAVSETGTIDGKPYPPAAPPIKQ